MPDDEAVTNYDPCLWETSPGIWVKLPENCTVEFDENGDAVIHVHGVVYE